MVIFFGADHAGSLLKQALLEDLQAFNFDVKDCGVTPETQAADYPDLAVSVVKGLQKDGPPNTFGVLVCGSGIGMVIAANRIPHVRAVLCHNAQEAVRARTHNNANVLCLGSQITSKKESLKILKAFLETAGPTEERHLRRIEKMGKLP